MIILAVLALSATGWWRQHANTLPELAAFNTGTALMFCAWEASDWLKRKFPR